MRSSKTRKIISFAIDFAMYAVMVMQMLYVFTGNTIHEIMGMGLFALLICHMVIKRRWFRLVLHRKGKLFSARRFADLMIVLVMISMALLALSSMSVSRLLFPKIYIMGGGTLHWTLATMALTFAAIHGGMHIYFGAKKKLGAAAVVALLAVAAFSIGNWLVPYVNRHYRTVYVPSWRLENVEQLNWKNGKPLVVYFTRVGNTDFEKKVDAVSGASLMKFEGELMGNTQFMTALLDGMIDCDTAAITLTGEHYPSSYADTCTVGGQEIRQNARPGIEPIEIAGYDDIILVYPIWWGTIPAPVATFLESGDFAGKTIHLLATQGSSGFASSTKDVRALVPDAEVKEAISVYCDDAPKCGGALAQWMLDSGLAE